MKSKLLHLLTNYRTSEEKKELIEVSYKLAIQYILYNHRRVKKILLHEELTSKELALDAIASLFETDENDKFVLIEKAFKKWKPPITNENEAIFFLNKLIQKRVEQHISKLLREMDPFFSKLLDKVNYQIKKYGYKKINYLGNVYIVQSGREKDFGKFIKEDEFNQISLSFFNCEDNLLKNIFTYLEKETEFTQAIPLNQLIFKLKELETSVFEFNEFTNDYSEENNLEILLQNAIRKTLSKLCNSYLKKGKLSEEEYYMFEKALTDIAYDLKDGGVNPGLCNYLMLHNKEITNEIYMKQYRNILEYLYKVLKREIAIELKSSK